MLGHSSPSGDPDGRDFALLKEDSNHARRNELIAELAVRLGIHDDQRDALADIEAVLSQIAEYGRAVHAEMEVILACARNGVSPRGGTLVTTTFPCHNCARHLVASGIKRVVCIEPYPKSLAPRLHEDSISITAPGEERKGQVSFEPFIGIGPRRFLDLFSLTLSAGYEIRRKKLSEDEGGSKGRIEMPERASGKDDESWRNGTGPRVPLYRASYLEREMQVVREGETGLPVSEMFKKNGAEP